MLRKSTSDIREMHYSYDKPFEVYHLIYEGDPQLPEVKEKGHCSHRLKVEGEMRE